MTLRTTLPTPEIEASRVREGALLRRRLVLVVGMLLALLVGAGGAEAGTPPCTRLLTDTEFARPLDETERGDVVESLAAMLERLYLHREQGRAMAAALRTKQSQGGYSQYSGARELAQALVADMRAVTPDKHLQVRARIIEPESAAPTEVDSEAAKEARRERFRRGAAYDGFGIDTVRVLFGNIGYLKLREFWSPAVAGEKLAGAMTIIGDADAVIIDLRESYGGHEDVVSVLMGYFLRNPVLLFQTSDATTGKTIQSWSAAFVPGTRIRSTSPVYVLTSSKTTFSSAEMLAIALRRHRDAVVIGERTRGGANGGDFLPLSCRFDAFVPYYGAVDDEGNSWEGTGIEPDVPVEAATALLTAYKAALESLLNRPDRPGDQLSAEIRQERADKLRKLEAGEDLP